jgi:hypothetical protein
MNIVLRMIALWLTLLPAAWSQSFLKCPPATTRFLSICEKTPSLLGRFLILNSTNSGGNTSKFIYSAQAVSKYLALVAFFFLRRATTEDIKKLCAAAPDLAQSYIYALRVARDDESAALLAKAAGTKIWGSVYRDTFAASYQNMRLLPDDLFRDALALSNEAQSAPANALELDAMRLGMAYAQAFNIYNGTIDLTQACSETWLSLEPSRLKSCDTLAKRLEVDAETTLELGNALDILQRTAGSESQRAQLIAKANAWAEISTSVMTSLGGFISPQRREFMLKILRRTEPDVLVEYYRKLPNANLALLAIVEAQL